jgi:hypothetical protein
MNSIRSARWSPYVCGALLGLLSCFAFYTAGRPIGVSTALAKTVGLAEQAVAPGHAGNNPYFQEIKLRIDWEWMLVAGLAIGAWAAKRTAKEPAPDPVPALWRERFGPSMRKRLVASFFAGALLIFGARVAGGCTSGHGISGSLQLAVSSWTFFLTIFAAAILTAQLLYGGRRHV